MDTRARARAHMGVWSAQNVGLVTWPQ